MAIKKVSKKNYVAKKIVKQSNQRLADKLEKEKRFLLKTNPKYQIHHAEIINAFQDHYSRLGKIPNTSQLSILTKLSRAIVSKHIKDINIFDMFLNSKTKMLLPNIVNNLAVQCEQLVDSKDIKLLFQLLTGSLFKKLGDEATEESSRIPLFTNIKKVEKK